MSEHEITLVIEANGRPIKSVTGSEPLRHLKLTVSTTDGSGRQELLLSFDFDVTPRTGHGPVVREPERGGLQPGPRPDPA